MKAKQYLPLLALLPAAALAAPNDQLQSLRTQIVALQLDHTLDLSKQQAQALLPLLKSAKAQVDAFEAQQAAAEPALASALNQAVSDLRSTGAVSPSTAQAVNAARPSRQALHDQLRSTWQQAQQILTPAQRDAVRSTRFGIPQDATAAPPAGGPHRGPGRHFMMMHAALSDAFIALVQARAG
jgi:hypothetical protein